MKIIRFEDMRRMPWKNGLGVTTEIAIYPETGLLTDASFDWRISMAEILNPGPFSIFSGFDRLLLVWSGAALSLNGRAMEYLVPRQFRGEEEVHAEPSGLIKDLGIVFRRGHVRAKMRGLYSGRAATLPGRNFVVNVGAPCNIVIGSTYHLGEGDALDFGICEAAESFTMHAPTGAGDETSGEALGVLISIVD